MDLRRVPRVLAMLPSALVEQRREVRAIAQALPKLEARIEAIQRRLAEDDLRWSRSGDVELVRGEEGLFLVLTRDVGISQVIRSTGVWAPHDLKLFRRLISPGDHVVDVGANLGHHTVVLSKLVGPSGRVLAIEPQTLMFRLINANLLLNGCNNVTVERCAAGEQAGIVKLWPVDYSVGNNYGALGVSRHEGELVLEHEGETAPVFRLDEILSRLEWGRVDFLKVDAQTYDLYVLQGSEATVCSRRPVIFVEVSPYWMRRTGYDYREIYQFLQRMDYTVFEPHRSLVDPAPIREWSGDEGEEWDLLAVPAERAETVRQLAEASSASAPR
jgi:FkbM family methyltransferase